MNVNELKTALQDCRTLEEIEAYLDGKGISYTISDNPKILIKNYTSSDAFSEEDVEWLISTDEKTLIAQFKLKPDAYYIKIKEYYLFVYDV